MFSQELKEITELLYYGRIKPEQGAKDIKKIISKHLGEKEKMPTHEEIVEDVLNGEDTEINYKRGSNNRLNQIKKNLELN